MRSVHVTARTLRLPILVVFGMFLLAPGCEEPVSFEETKEFQFGYETLQRWFYDQMRVPSQPYDFDSLHQIYETVNDEGTFYLSTAPSDSILADTDTVPEFTISGTDLGVLLDSVGSGYVVTEILSGSAVASPDTTVDIFVIRDTIKCDSSELIVLSDTLRFSEFDTSIIHDTIQCDSVVSSVVRDTLIRDTIIEILEQGDIITAVGVDTLAGLPRDTVAKLISGSVGSRKEIYFTGREGRRGFLDVNIRSYPPKTVFRQEVGNGTHYIRIAAVSPESQDSAGTSGEMRKALRSVGPSDVVILDLRDLPGKNIVEALDIAEEFPHDGDRGVSYLRRYYDGRMGSVVTRRKAMVGSRPAIDGPGEVRIRINEGTRVAAEALCRGIRSGQSIPVTILGTRSVDNGSCRKQIETPEGGLCSITYSRVTLPDGSTWENGIQPDTETDFAGQPFSSIPDTRFGFE